MTRRVGGVPVEMGGQWIGPGQKRINALAKELGVGIFPTEVPGRTVFYEGGRRSEYEEEGEVPFADPGAASEVREAFEALSRPVVGEGGRGSEYEEEGGVPFADPGAASEVREVFEALSRLAADVPAEAPWTAGGAGGGDGRAVGAWERG